MVEVAECSSAEQMLLIAVQLNMQALCRSTRVAVHVAFVAATLLLTGCAAKKPTHPIGEAPEPVYDTAEKIQAMPRCEATVLERGPCFVYCRTAKAEGFYIGSPANSAEVGRFLDLLKDGQTYKFPETFIHYRKQRRKAES